MASFQTRKNVIFLIDVPRKNVYHRCGEVIA